jgi:hypothetical protein
MAECPTGRVVVTDVNMPFFSMVRFMVKWAVASIPALLILVVLTALLWGVVIGAVSSFGSHVFKGNSSQLPTTSSTPPVEGATAAADSSAPIDADAAAYLPNVLVRNVTVGKSVLEETGVFGEVKNAGTRTLKSVQITIYCLGADGKPVFEKTYSPVRVSEYSIGDANSPLKPGYSRQFGVKLEDAPSDWNKKVDVKVTAVEFE